jgi:hypothetical protein
MLVYGDHCEFLDPRERLGCLPERLATIAAMPAGIDRHAKLVGALIDAGQLLQGVADAGLAGRELGDFVHRLAVVVVRSWDSHFAAFGKLPPVPDLALPETVELRLPEGFAFYAVYPEGYVAAARRLRLTGPPRVIGIRSIGTTLGAIVAATLGAPPAITVRPFGDPFARQVELPAEVPEEGAHYVIVDEGPGLSGSSFGSVADALERRGVPTERIAFLPSHGGDLGPQASERHRLRWTRVQRVPVEFAPGFLSDHFGKLDEFSTGHPWERRKYLADRDGDRMLLKFAGLGPIGERKVRMARALHAAGFTPEPLALVHGFLVERWCGDARSLREDDRPVEEIGRYIGARKRLFPANDVSGASVEELLTMCRRNISLALGSDAINDLDLFAERLPKGLNRVRTDNKLDRAEWLRSTKGRLIKTDALDHHQAHDLVGCQAMEWDIAGAIAEFDLNAGETERLIAATGRAADRHLLAFYRIAYAAFRFGHARLAAESGGSTIVSSRLKRSADRYGRSLELLLHEDTCCCEMAEILG